MNPTCHEVEALLCDFLDGVLDAATRARLELHLSQCPACQELVNDVRLATRFLAQVEPIQPPPELVTRILFATHDAPAPAPAPSRQPRGRLAQFAAWLHGLLEPLLQPRFAMGMAMTILSFSLIGRFAGVSQKTLTAADLNPAKIWVAVDNKVHRLWERLVKNYENLRVVYQIQTALSEWSAQEEEDRRSQQSIDPNETAPPPDSNPRSDSR